MHLLAPKETSWSEERNKECDFVAVDGSITRWDRIPPKTTQEPLFVQLGRQAHKIHIELLQRRVREYLHLSICHELITLNAGAVPSVNELPP